MFLVHGTVEVRVGAHTHAQITSVVAKGNNRIASVTTDGSGFQLAARSLCSGNRCRLV